MWRVVKNMIVNKKSFAKELEVLDSVHYGRAEGERAKMLTYIF